MVIPAGAATPVFVRFNTNLGNIDVELLSNDAPKTVANFLTYVDSGAYTNSFFHRSVAGFVFQGGGFKLQGTQVVEIPTNPPVVNEFKISNVRGTIAMAKLSSGPDTATSQWFFNEVDNSANLDNQNGGFTVFGVVANNASLTIMDQIAEVHAYPLVSYLGAAFDSVPLLNYTAGNSPTLQNLVMVNSITRLTQNFATWQTAHFTQGQLGNAAISGVPATPQHDGVTNLMKYVTNIDPSRPMTAADRAALPVSGNISSGGVQYLTISYRQYAQLSGVTINVQTSTDLRTWTTLSNPTIVQTGLDATTGDPLMQVQIPLSGTRLLARLNVTVP